MHDRERDAENRGALGTVGRGRDREVENRGALGTVGVRRDREAENRAVLGTVGRGREQEPVAENRATLVGEAACDLASSLVDGLALLLSMSLDTYVTKKKAQT
jgi:hypothetical protein